MPHCIIEYTERVADQVSIEELVKAVHEGTFSSGLFPEYDIKARAVACGFHSTGSTRDSFVHVTVRMLSGRDDAQKKDLSEKLLARIEPMLPDVVSIGVEICDMHRDSYRKRVLG